MGFIIYIIILLIVPLYLQYKVKSTYKRYGKVASTSGLTGKEVAELLLRENGIKDVAVLSGGGLLSDYYDPNKKEVVLSEENYSTASVSGTAVASHEVGHAIQHATSYKFLTFRNSFFPLANIGSRLSFPLILVGILVTMFLSSPFGNILLLLGIGFFSLAVLFEVVTLPVEFDASKRALVQMEEFNIIEGKEVRHAKKVLNAAALTYVAATAIAILELVRLIGIYNSD